MRGAPLYLRLANKPWTPYGTPPRFVQWLNRRSAKKALRRLEELRKQAW